MQFISCSALVSTPSVDHKLVVEVQHTAIIFLLWSSGRCFIPHLCAQHCRQVDLKECIEAGTEVSTNAPKEVGTLAVGGNGHALHMVG